MSSAGQGPRRPELSEPLVSWRTRSTLTMLVVVAVAAMCWHVAVAATTVGIGVADVGVTLQGLLRGELVPTGPGVDSPSLATVGAVFGGLLAALFASALMFAFVWGSRSAGTASAAGFASRPQVRAQLGAKALTRGADELRPGGIQAAGSSTKRRG